MNAIKYLLLLYTGLILIHCGGVFKSRQSFTPNVDNFTMPSTWQNGLFSKIYNEKQFKHKVALLGFNEVLEIPTTTPILLSAVLKEHLQRSGKFEMINQRIVNEKISVESFATITANNLPGSYKKIGSMVGAESIITGKVIHASLDTFKTSLHSVLRIQIDAEYRVISLLTGEVLLDDKTNGIIEKSIIKTDSVTPKKDNGNVGLLYARAIEKVTGKMSEKISSFFPRIGFIVQISGTNIITDIGKERGISKGDQLVIFRRGGKVTGENPDSPSSWKNIILGTGEIKNTDNYISMGKILKKNSGYGEIASGDLVITIN